jgi:hypothetical protein
VGHRHYHDDRRRHISKTIAETIIRIVVQKGTQKMKDRSKESIDSAQHIPDYDAARINHAIERAAQNHDFLNYALTQIAGLSFPAFKRDIIDHVNKTNADQREDVVSLFESLDGYIQFRDKYHVQKALEENIPVRKKDHQISDKSRESPNVRIRQTTDDANIKDRQAVNEREERKDYPEVTPTAMSNFTCKTCGKEFQNQQDLIHHRHFESGIN